MTYKQLSMIVREMGGRLSYSLEGFTRELKVSFNYDNKFSQYRTSSVRENVVLTNMEGYLSKVYPIQFANAKRQLSIK